MFSKKFKENNNNTLKDFFNMGKKFQDMGEYETAYEIFGTLAKNYPNCKPCKMRRGQNLRNIINEKGEEYFFKRYSNSENQLEDKLKSGWNQNK